MVAVITGASSGIGEATAIAFAKAGINVVLGARRGPLLEEVAATCRQYGVRAMAVETDVADEVAVAHLSRTAVDVFGSYDVWINNAAVSVLGAFADVPAEQFRQVIETNFFGYVYGSRTALQHFEANGAGVLIQISSLVGTMPSPFESPYVASKYAVTGLSAALRQELALRGQEDVHICTVLPAAIATPLYRNAANVSGYAARPPRPLYPVSAVTNAVMELIASPQPEVIVGRAGHLASLLYRLMPHAVFERLFGKYIAQAHFTSQNEPAVVGNLTKPGTYEGISGNWATPLYKRKQLYYAAAGIVAALAYVAWRKRQSAKQ
jgi:short-subunit dehydrogenase